MTSFPDIPTIAVILVAHVCVFAIVFTSTVGVGGCVRNFAVGLSLHLASFIAAPVLMDGGRPGVLIVVASMYALGLAAFGGGVLNFFGERARGAFIWLPPALILATAPLIGESDVGRVVIRGAIFAAQIWFTARLLANNASRTPGYGKFVLGSGLVFVLVGLLSRVVYLLVEGRVYLDPINLAAAGSFGPFSLSHLSTMFVMAVSSIMIAVGGLIMVKDRLHFQAINARAHVQGILDSIPSQLCVVSPSGEITAVNEAWRRFADENIDDRAPSPDHIGMNYLNVCRGVSGDGARAFEGIRAVLDRSRASYQMEYPCDSPDRARWFMMTVSPLNDAEEGAVVVHTDITARKEIEAVKERSAAMFDKLSGMVPGVIFKLVRSASGRSRFEYVSVGVDRLGLEARRLNEDAAEFFALIHPDDRDEVEATSRRSLAPLGLWRVQFRLAQLDGSYRWFEVQAKPEEEGGGRWVWYGHLVDINEQKHVEACIRGRAERDPLTGLHNRAFFEERFSCSLASVEGDGGKTALLFIDLDRFKPVNDRLGHQVGDRLLREVAARLRRCLRDIDTPARVGGDEFVALLHRIRDEAEAREVADRIRAAMAAPFHIADHVLSISASIGIAVYPDHGTDPAALVSYADQAMYRDKLRARGTTDAPPIA